MSIKKFKAINCLLNPKSVAIIGASSDSKKFSGMIIPNLTNAGFKGKIYPINPRRKEIFGFKAYPSILDVTGDIDLACVVTPRDAVLPTVKECVRKGVKAIIVLTAGFAEIGGRGKELQDRIVQVLKGSGVVMCGPNSEGIISLPSSLWLSFFSEPNLKPVSGQISLITQSGGVGEHILIHMWERGIGIRYWISVGNQGDLEISDYIEYLIKDPGTKVISTFFEGIKHGDKFKRVLDEALKANKPIVVLKAGKSEKAALTALSHTGSLTGSDQVYNAVFRQYNVNRVYRLDELYDVSAALAWLPSPKGKRVGVVTDSGGLACLIADLAEEKGIEIPDFTEDTVKRLRMQLPSVATIKNPLDLTAAVTPEEHSENMNLSVQTILEDGNVDSVIVAISWWPHEILYKMCKNIVKSFSNNRKPLILILTSITYTKDQDIITMLARNQIPMYLTPENGLISLKSLIWYNRMLNRTVSVKQ